MPCDFESRAGLLVVYIMMRINCIEKVTCKERSGVGKRMVLGISKRKTFRKKEQLGLGLKGNVCLEFSRNTKDATVAGLERVGSERTGGNQWVGPGEVGPVGHCKNLGFRAE